MRHRRWTKVAAVVAALCLPLLFTLPADSAEPPPDEPAAPTLELPPPSWYTADLHDRIVASGHDGLEVPLDHDGLIGDLSCLGYSPPSTEPTVLAVSAGGCMVHPHGCTMNFVFTDGSSNYIGTAGHCVDKGGDVVMQVGSRVDATDTVIVTLAKVGRVAKRVDGGVGRDFGLVKIDSRWAVNPGVAGAAGPTDIFCGDPIGQPVAHYGHGYVFLVGPGVAKVGEVILDLHPTIKFASTDHGYNWVGYGLPGDSGSPVMNGAGLVVGNLTHGLGIAGVPLPGLNFGTTTEGMFAIAGSQISLVTVDGRAVRCPGILDINLLVG